MSRNLRIVLLSLGFLWLAVPARGQVKPSLFRLPYYAPRDFGRYVHRHPVVVVQMLAAGLDAGQTLFWLGRKDCRMERTRGYYWEWVRVCFTDREGIAPTQSKTLVVLGAAGGVIATDLLAHWLREHHHRKLAKIPPWVQIGANIFGAVYSFAQGSGFH